MRDILAGLNDEQRRAVETIDGPLLILAGAGSGKTRVLTHRIAHMLQNGVRPWNILAVTFTNKAASEMKARVAALVGEGADKILVTTFHSACVRFLRRDIAALGYRTSFTIFDTDDQIRLIKSILKDMGLDPKARPPRAFLSHIESAKNSMKPPDPTAANRGDHAEQIYLRYQTALKENNGVDFNDLIGLMVRLFKENPEILDRYQERYKYLMVDEYQDTNQAQYQLVQLLAAKYRNLAVVGDDDQSIYAFRGADISNILNFNKHFPDAAVIRLERNYRSTGTILKAASTVVARNRGRMAKTMWTEAGDGEKIGVIIGSDEEREAELIVQRIQKLCQKGRKPSDFAIIYRSNAASRIFEQQLLQARLPHVLIGAQKFYERREIRDVLGYLKLILNPTDDMAFQRVINSPPRGIGGKSLQGIIEEANLRGMPLLEAARGWSMRGRGKARTSSGDFCRMIDSLTAEALIVEPGKLVKQVATRSGYLDRINKENTPESQARLENINELIRAMESAVEDEGIDEDESPL
ncbi:MAG: DNA helicase-2/ATP-dependent DNA helicase PcrA, partial [Myxococcota bacterium]